jgi:hypothetical protein
MPHVFGPKRHFLSKYCRNRAGGDFPPKRRGGEQENLGVERVHTRNTYVSNYIIVHSFVFVNTKIYFLYRKGLAGWAHRPGLAQNDGGAVHPPCVLKQSVVMIYGTIANRPTVAGRFVRVIGAHSWLNSAKRHAREIGILNHGWARMGTDKKGVEIQNCRVYLFRRMGAKAQRRGKGACWWYNEWTT